MPSIGVGGANGVVYIQQIQVHAEGFPDGRTFIFMPSGDTVTVNAPGGTLIAQNTGMMFRLPSTFVSIHYGGHGSYMCSAEDIGYPWKHVPEQIAGHFANIDLPGLDRVCEEEIDSDATEKLETHAVEIENSNGLRVSLLVRIRFGKPEPSPEWIASEAEILQYDNANHIDIGRVFTDAYKCHAKVKELLAWFIGRAIELNNGEAA